MIRVKDDTGNVIKNLYRSNDMLLVNDANEKNKYQKQIQELRKIQELEKEVDMLKTLVQQLLEKHG